MALAGDAGLTDQWPAPEVLRRSRLAAWRLHSLGLRLGDRLLTWCPSGPELAAVTFGAMRLGVAIVPLDLRMAPEVVERIAARADTRYLAIGTGRDAPDPREVQLVGRHHPHRAIARRGARRRRRPAISRGLAGADRRAARGRASDALRDRLHLGHDRRAEGRHAHARQHPGHARSRRPRRAAQASIASSRCCRSRISSASSSWATRCWSGPPSSTSARATRGSSSRPSAPIR